MRSLRMPLAATAVALALATADASAQFTNIYFFGDSLQYLVGASADFGSFTGYVTGSGTSGRSDGDGYGVTVGVRVPF